MAISYCWEGFSRPYAANKFWSKPIGDLVLVTVHHGDWLALTREEFSLLQHGKAHEDPHLFGLLREKGVLVDEAAADKLVSTYKGRFSHLFSGPTLHIIVPTLNCNHTCIYCHARSKPAAAKGFSMDRKTAKAVVDFIFQSPAKELTIEFQGGEPLLNFPVVRYIIEYSKQLSRFHGKKLYYVLVTNLTLMTDEMLDYLIDNDVRLCTSFDGPEHIHAKNRPSPSEPDSYPKTVFWINNIMKSRRYPKFSALLTVTRHSLPHAKEIIDSYVRMGFSGIALRPLNNAGMANAHWEKIGYSPDEFLAFWKECLGYILELNRQGIAFRESTMAQVLRRVTSLGGPSYTCMSAPCGAALMQSAYDQDGNVFTCDEARSFDIFRLGNVKDSSFSQVYASKEVSDVIALTSNEGSMCAGCVWHPFCAPCMVCVYGEQGSPNPKPLSSDCRIKKGMFEYVFGKLLFEKDDARIFLGWLK